MRILPVFNNIATKKNSTANKNNISKITPTSLNMTITEEIPNSPKSNNSLYLLLYMPGFNGGYSLNLKDTYKNLSALEKEGTTQFPPDIKSLIEKTLENEDCKDKCLISVHKQKYQGLNDCYDLNEVRILYPEFQDVLSDKDVTYHKNSFMDDVKNDKYENFNSEEDLAFQLLKLYWAEGFSLTDLQEYTIDGGIEAKTLAERKEKRKEGTSLYHTMKKLNIPLMSRDYAHILKFSDKEYNDRITSIMTENRQAAQDRRAQKEDNEPVYIPRGPLSESHKKHISEGLIRHYAQNPEKLLKMSERQLEYWINNPEQREYMRKVTTYAHRNTPEGKSIDKYMKKFFKKKNVSIPNDIMENPGNMDELQKKTFSDFWKINGWAAKEWSKAMTKAHKTIKEEKEAEAKTADSLNEENVTATTVKQPEKRGDTPYKIRIVPKALAEHTITLAKRKGIDTNKINITTYYFDKNFLKEEDGIDLFNWGAKNYPNFIHDFQIALYSLVKSFTADFSENRLNDIINPGSELYEHVQTISKKTIKKLIDAGEDKPVADILIDFLMEIGKAAVIYKCPELINTVQHKIDYGYDLYLKRNQSGIPDKMLQQFLGDAPIIPEYKIS